MSKEKQIEEMVCNACITKPTCTDTEKAKCMRRNFAICVIKQGYRKQSEGEWTKEVTDMWHCSVCLHPCLLNGGEDYVLSNFCPHCGAHMRKEDEGK